MKILEDLEKLVKTTERLNKPDIEQMRIRAIEMDKLLRRGAEQR